MKLKKQTKSKQKPVRKATSRPTLSRDVQTVASSVPARIVAPVRLSQEIVTKVCERIAHGESLRAICADNDMPSRSAFLNWLREDEDVLRQYTRAREHQADFLVDEILEISDDGKRDYKRDADGNIVVDHDHIARARLRVDSRKWFASKVLPKKYGDKSTHEHSGPDGNPIEIRPVINLYGKPE